MLPLSGLDSLHKAPVNALWDADIAARRKIIKAREEVHDCELNLFGAAVDLDRSRFALSRAENEQDALASRFSLDLLIAAQ
jgi:hypothetical protein